MYESNNIRQISRRDFIAAVAGTGISSYLAAFLPEKAYAIAMNQEEGKLVWPGHVEDFGSVAFDKTEYERLWTAIVERPVPDRYIGVYVFEGNNKKKIGNLKLKGMTGIGAPAVASFDRGCVVCFPIEKDDKWAIAYSFIGFKHGASKIKLLNCPGKSNISPAVTISRGKAFIVWESNAGAKRGIYSCFVTQEGYVSEIKRITGTDANSYNPSIVSLTNGSIFAAWDTVKNDSADIYGAWYRKDRWESEIRLTSDGRIERHPFLTSKDDELWMTWQAQSYKKGKTGSIRRINNLNEQHIVVAKIENRDLLCPKEFFTKISDGKRKLMKPRIAFDGSNRLWLIARESIGLHSGWLPKAWCYSGEQWSQAKVLLDHQGRWRPVAIAVKRDGSIFTSVQYDDLPQTWTQMGIHEDWKSGVTIQSISNAEQLPSSKLVLEPLKMPATDFTVADKMQLCFADLPRQTVKYKGQDLKLFWGDFHEHTDLSVCVRDINPPGHDLFANERDIEKLDFCALTDHGYNFDPPQWQYNGEQTRQNHDAGRFVTFLGEEWTSGEHPPLNPGEPNRYGHHNLIFLDSYYDKSYDAFDGDISPTELWKQLEGTEFICIPHQLADWKHKGKINPPTDWRHIHEKYQPVAEIFQARESYEYLGCPRQARDSAPFKGYYLQDAWANGIIIGVIASPDHGGGKGKVGLWGKDLSREAIFEAVRARHTFGTSGSKMGLFFSSNEAMMGDKLKKSSGPIPFHIKAIAMHNIKELVIFRNNDMVYRVVPMKKEIDLNWRDDNPPYEKDLLWYYTRIHTEDNQLAWSSPIWFS